MRRRKNQGQARPGDEALAKTRAERRREERLANRGRGPKAVLLGMIVVALTISSLYPARQLVAKRARIVTLKRSSAELDAQIARLRDQRDALQTDAEVERLARAQLGMIFPGETAYAVVPGPPVLPAPPARNTGLGPARQPSRGVVARWWDAITRTFTSTR